MNLVLHKLLALDPVSRVICLSFVFEKMLLRANFCLLRDYFYVFSFLRCFLIMMILVKLEVVIEVGLNRLLLFGLEVDMI